MSARLTALEGSCAGREITVGDEFPIGRAPTNGLVLPDISVSRHHCLISKGDQEFRISDLGTANGTFVNGIRILEQALRHGDEIRVGPNRFVFLDRTEAEDWAGGGATCFRDTVILKPECATSFQAASTATRDSRDLRALLKLSGDLSALNSIGELTHALLRAVFEAVPARRGAVVFTSDSVEPDFVLAWQQGCGPVAPFPLSRTVVDHVLGERVGLLGGDPTGDPQLAQSGSLITANVKSVAAAPILWREKSLGLIYIDSSDPNTPLGTDDLRFLLAAAGLGAAAFENIRRFEWLEIENRRLMDEISIQHEMVGESALMRRVYAFISKAAPADATVLITGESGTGKELVARAIHRNSPRARYPLVIINCAALTETLLESELFGHERGAFTGAVAQKKGKLETAEGGTVFLDEIGEMPLASQAKLLRFLQQHEFERVGGNRTIHVNVRVLAATNRDLAGEAAQDRFRQDLFYRLNVLAVRLPALRERPEDITSLASYFATKIAARNNRKITGISREARACLQRYAWPGNVRELENAIERAVVLGASDQILPEDLPEAVVETAMGAPGAISRYHEGVNEAKRELIRKAIEHADGNQAEAARLLGLNPKYLYRLMLNLNLREA